MAQNPLDLSGSDIIVNNIYQGASTPGSAGTIANESALSGITPGTVTASKAVIVDSSKNISTFGTLASGAITAPSLTSGTNLTLNATGTGTIGIGNVSTGVVTITPNTAVTGTLTSGAVTAPSVTSATNLTLNATTTGTIGIGSVSTGAVTVTPLLNANGGVVHGAGTTSVAPIVLTAGTNLTTAAAGAVEFDGTAFYATSVASSRQQLDAEQFIIATANSATYSNTGLDTASAAALFTSTTNSGVTNGALTLVSGKTYIFEFLYNLTNTGTTSHTWATAFGGTASFSTGTNYQVFGNSGTAASTPATGGLTGFIASTTMSTAVVCTAASTSATEQVSVEGYGTFVINAGGTVIPQMKASARPGATGTPGVILLAGSYFRIWEMGTNNFVGNWS